MAYVSMTEMLVDADKGNYAVGAFNIFSWESFVGIVQAAEEKRSPVIFNVNPIHFELIDIEKMLPAVKSMAEKSDVPFAMNLDHGTTLDVVKFALELGFSSVMFDGSSLAFDENIGNSHKTKQMATNKNASVEAELGTLSQDSGGFTDPDKAVEFVEKTGVDCLAVAIGNAHGFYKKEPRLEFELLKTIKSKVNVPLALHGGSGISDDDFRKGIKLGLRKINIYTEMNHAASIAAAEFYHNGHTGRDINDLMISTVKTIKDVVLHKIDVMGSAGKA